MGILKSLVSGILAGYPGIQQKFTKIQDNHFKPFFLAILESGNCLQISLFFLKKCQCNEICHIL